MKKLLFITLLISSLICFCTANAATLFNTISSPLNWDFSFNLSNGPYTEGFSVPTGETWSIDTITLNIGQGSTADMFLTILNNSYNPIVNGQTEVTQISQLINFVETDFYFTTLPILNSGDYFVRSSYQITGIDMGSFWAANCGSGPFEMRIDGTKIPVPSAVWLLGSGLIGLVGYRKKFRKV